MRDDYGRLIKAEKGPIGALREGGDSLGGRPLAVVPQRTVALFSGLVKIGSDGVANVPLEIPDFNGELRLMAVAMTADKLGAADRPLTVRDPVVADIVLPRFLAPGDHADAALNMNNVEGAPGTYTATVTASGPVGLDAGAPQDVVTRQLAKGQRVLVPVVLVAKGMGIATISLKLTGPKGFSVSRAWPIEVRAPQMDVSRDQVAILKPGETYTAGKSLIDGIVPSTAVVALNVSASHGYSDVPGLLRWLDKYPYGCIEQTTSAAMPLLYFNDMAGMAGLPKDEKLHTRIQNAADNVLDMQNYAGDFGMWGPGSSADPWISVFALDFLEQAKAKGYVVADEPLRRGVLCAGARRPGESVGSALLQRHPRTRLEHLDRRRAHGRRRRRSRRSQPRRLCLRPRPRNRAGGPSRPLPDRQFRLAGARSGGHHGAGDPGRRAADRAGVDEPHLDHGHAAQRHHHPGQGLDAAGRL
jgi:hypothetical protein